MAMSELVFAVLIFGALGASYLTIREYDSMSRSDTQTNLTLLEVGSLFTTIFWGVIAFNAFDVQSGSTVVVTRSHTGLALLAAGAGIISALVFIGALTGTVTPGRGETERMQP